MLPKNSRMKIEGTAKQLRLPIRNAPAALLIGFCVLLSGSAGFAQDLLLKEYIYLDERLLAVERQVLTQAAQLPAIDSDKATKTEFASGFIFPDLQSSLPTGNQSMHVFRDQVLGTSSYPDSARYRFIGRERYPEQSGAIRWHRGAGGLSENGGKDENQ
ncbi:MAG TPA: hypothetical protein VMG30_11790 [Acidobacteriota bacterium]|nr:hypothetical protein [Acidobacteriota bacterium]